jgi:hypothetical protein
MGELLRLMLSLLCVGKGNDPWRRCPLPASCTTCFRRRHACSLWEEPFCGAVVVVRLQCVLCVVSSFPNRRYFTGAPLASFSLLPHPARPVLAPASANTPPVPTGRLARKRRQNPQLDLGVRVSFVQRTTAEAGTRERRGGGGREGRVVVGD